MSDRKKRGKKKGGEGESSTTRIAIVSSDKCKPKKCRQECKRNCPVVRMGKLCIEVEPTSKISKISEELCVGCGICVKKCPFDAISIINLPKNLDADTTHRYGPNSFKLHRLPMPRPGNVLGLVGTNGIGKSTALKVLAGKLKPNLGNYTEVPDWQEILKYFRGSELQNFFTKLLEDDIKAIIKPQYVDHIPRAVKGKVLEILTRKDERDAIEELCDDLDLKNVQDRKIQDLSGGELQRFAIAVMCVQAADIYMFDEPSSYLDVKQRLKAAQVIRDMTGTKNYVIVVEHDLSVLDYLSDSVCCLYGTPGAYGVVTMPFSVREGINVFLAGFVPTENLRFRDVELTFKVAEHIQDNGVDKRTFQYQYPDMKKTLGTFSLTVEEGEFTNSEILVMLGQNGTGKTTFIRMLAGLLQPDGDQKVPQLNVSYKPQKIAPKFPGSVRQLLHAKIRGTYIHPQFVADVMKPLRMEEIMDRQVKTLSGGELQRVAITLTLGKPADIYLIDEPSAYLDSEQRIVAAKVIKRFILHAKKTAFVVEHDFIMATYLADRVVVYTGTPAIGCTAHSPQSLLDGMNAFLKGLEITFRRDPTNFRPRINKAGSIKDSEQKRAGTYFYLDFDDDELSELTAAERKKLQKERKEQKRLAQSMADKKKKEEDEKKRLEEEKKLVAGIKAEQAAKADE
jgi:ATP-binding cassette subfamily E protein 1